MFNILVWYVHWNFFAAFCLTRGVGACLDLPKMTKYVYPSIASLTVLNIDAISQNWHIWLMLSIDAFWVVTAETATVSVLLKRLFLKISQYSQEHFFNKSADLQAYKFIKKKL